MAESNASSGSTPLAPWPSAPGPISTATPAKPTMTPASLLARNRSSARKNGASSTENNGVAALMIAASDEVMLCCAQTDNDHGMTLLSAPMTRNAAQIFGPRGKPSGAKNSTGVSATTAITTRSMTSVSGVTPPNATFTNGKEQPHIRDRRPSIAHVRSDMDVSTAGILEADMRAPVARAI